jgi:uncharacterized damage-inducible protein DinB
MPIIDAFLAEMGHESTLTRRLLERVPDDRMGWKPHDKSMTLGRLAGHVAELPGWSRTVLADDVFEVSAAAEAGFVPAEPATRAELLAIFDDHVAGFEAAARGVSDETMRETWKMTRGGRVLLEMPRTVAVRSFILNHTIHHRGQLSVYLRLLEVPLPSIYGPSADDPGPFAEPAG